MAFNPQYLKAMSTTATYLQFINTNGYGEPNFQAAVSFVCHVTYKRTMIRTDTEEDRIASAVLQMPPPLYVVPTLSNPTPTVTIYDHIILPYDSLERKVIDVKTFTDGSAFATVGAHHQSIYLE